ncbi:peptidoglycan DD-metalloendopeptidase family protein [Cellulomonas timonensis]|uniref:peptidoglycan DD-metalloendopeptidase family protein n=1 Tax=Cellulomonas timonensis TaxID=1689271 RepID=UPI000836A86B|nr:M23 family metallopeptidase [Cellulomonas timonensis]
MSRRPRALSRMLALVLVGALAALTTVGGPAIADTLSDKRAAAKKLEQENAAKREQLAASLEGLSAELGQALMDLQAMEARMPQAQFELAEAEASLERSQREATLVAARLQDAEDQESSIGSTIEQDTARATHIRESIGQMAREAYKGRGAASSMGVVLGAESTEEFIEQYGLVSTALRTQTSTLDEMRTLQAQNLNSQARLEAVRGRIQELKAEADQKVVEADAARTQAQDRKDEIEQLIVQQAAKKAQIESQKAAAEAEAAAADAEAAKIAAELAAIAEAQRAADAAAAAAAGKPQTPAGPVSGSLFANPTSIKPMYVTSNYGMRLHPTLGYVRLHAGIDLRTYCGNPIYAGRAGTVQWAQYRYGFGNQVMLDHGLVNGSSLMSSYNHMTSFVVRSGQRVEQGTLLGYSGNTGTSAACHLHLEVYVNGVTQDPGPLLGL